MEVNIVRQQAVLRGAGGRPFTLDYTLQATGSPKPVVVFCHGFKGFKDWGHWSAVALAFARRGFCFVKFNFSHNGTTPDTPTDFSDLEAFGRNTYTRELYDLTVVLDQITEGAYLPEGESDSTRLYLVGHSRGGAIALLQAARDSRIKKLSTWAAVAELDYAWKDPAFVEKWRAQGVIHAYNGRTKQYMPLYFDLYRDFQEHREQYDCCRAAASLSVPWLIVHGTEDPAVPVEAAWQLHACNPSARLALIEGADHVFGGRHPWEGAALPAFSQTLVERVADFFAS